MSVPFSFIGPCLAFMASQAPPPSPPAQESSDVILASIKAGLALLEKCTHEKDGVCYESYDKGVAVYYK